MSAEFVVPNSGMVPAETKSPGEYLEMAKRRKVPMLLTAVIVFSFALMIALLWPATYRSSATILIEEQEIPEEMVRSTISSFAEQQIQVITQRVMITKNIMEMVEKFQLYSENELNRRPKGEIVREFADAVDLDLISAEGSRSGRSGSATIAFGLSYDNEDPGKAQKVTRELVNLYLNVNLRTRTEKTESTEAFLRQQTEVLNVELNDIEERLAEFKRQNKDALPDQFQFNAQNLVRLESQLASSRIQLREISTQESQIKAGLAKVSAYAPTVLASGETVLADADRLKALQSEYRKKAASYNANHPDVKKLRREIDALSATVGYAGDKEDLQALIKRHKAVLDNLSGKYAADHPDVLAQKRFIEQLEAQLAMADSGGPSTEPDNPDYIFLQNQLSSLRMQKVDLQQDTINLEKQVERLNQALLMAPAIEKQYLQLQRAHTATQDKFLELKRKLRDAELAGSLEQGLKGQRFTLIEPATLPGEPISPNRPSLVFVGFILACAAGIGVGILLEALDQSIRSEKDLIAATGRPPLVSIPYIKNPDEQKAGRPNTRLYVFIAIAVLILITSLFALHNFYKPLDVLWFVILRKLGIG